MNMLPRITSDPLVYIWLSYYSRLQLTEGKPSSQMSASIAVPKITQQPENDCVPFCILLLHLEPVSNYRVMKPSVKIR